MILNELGKKLNKADNSLKLIWFAVDLYEAVCNKDIAEFDADILWKRWKILASNHSWKDVMDNHIDYAISLSRYPGSLTFEEMLKLIATLQEIRVIEEIGYTFDNNKTILLQEFVKTRFSMERKVAKIAIQRMLANWNKDWWYNLLV